MSDGYDMIDRFLRNNLDDDDYEEFSQALEGLYTSAPTIPYEREVRYAGEGEYYRVEVYQEGYDEGWNDCRKAMLAARSKA